MGNKNIYLPDDLHNRLDQLGATFNVSAVCQAAIEAALEAETGRCARCGEPLRTVHVEGLTGG